MTVIKQEMVLMFSAKGTKTGVITRKQKNVII